MMPVDKVQRLVSFVPLGAKCLKIKDLKNFKPYPGQYEAQQRRGCRNAPAVRLPNKDSPAGGGTRKGKGNYKIKYYYCFANGNWLLGWCWCWCWAGAGAGAAVVAVVAVVVITEFIGGA